jgi:hypothetical protein
MSGCFNLPDCLGLEVGLDKELPFLLRFLQVMKGRIYALNFTQPSISNKSLDINIKI